MSRAERHDGSAAVPLCKHEDVRIDCLTAAPIFRGLSQSELYEIANSTQELRFSHRETIFRQGDPVRFIHLIVAGMVKVTDISANGKEVILRVDRKASVIDDVTDALQVHPWNAQAMGSCRALAWNASAFRGFAKRFPVIQRNAANIMLSNLRMLEQRFCDVTAERVPQRLARLLIRLAGETTPGALDPICLSREELSQMTGTCLFTVSRLLSSWRELDILTVDRKTVVIENLPGLLLIAQAAA
jgi:CRP/FNR family transcriptional regulator, nitrogen oxide reductase regulator